MKTMTVRGLLDEVFEFLRQLAAQNRRSLQEQVKTLLEQDAQLLQASSVGQASAWRTRLAGRAWGNLVDDIREERAR